jgi:hypothetical protein
VIGNAATFGLVPLSEARDLAQEPAIDGVRVAIWSEVSAQTSHEPGMLWFRRLL